MEQIPDETKALQSETASSSFYPHPITVASHHKYYNYQVVVVLDVKVLCLMISIQIMY